MRGEKQDIGSNPAGTGRATLQCLHRIRLKNLTAGGRTADYRLQTDAGIANIRSIIDYRARTGNTNMKIAVISDIHGNAAAFREVLKDIEGSGVSTVFSLGDNIGYGPEPEEVIRLLRAHEITSIIGNHELAVNDPRFLNWFNPIARISLEKTVGFLSGETLAYIAELPFFRIAHHCRFVHGFPPESATEYLFEVAPDRLTRTLRESEENICFVGHTHELVLVSKDEEGISKRPLKQETVVLETGCRYLINVGSVGQPRDGNNKAKYVIFDDQSLELEVRFVSYNVTETVNRIYQAGLPEQHAWCLL